MQLKKNKIILGIFVLMILVLILWEIPIRKKIFFIDGSVHEIYWTRGVLSQVKNGHSLSFNPDGTLIADDHFKSGILHGNCTYYYDNGKLRGIVTYDAGKLMNILKYLDVNGHNLNFGDFSNGNGNLKLYYENGILEEEGQMKNGYRNGVWVYYLNPDNPLIKAFTTYNNGVDQYGLYLKWAF
jgi:antitoxin component YwqK of YwqJK toxin-antitoxin module